MNRKHDREFYFSIVSKLRKINENIQISSDFIVGYPGETKKDFNDTIDLIEKIGFVNSYSFIFSPRPGTPAAKLKSNNLIDNQNKLKKLQSILEDYQLKSNNKYLKKNCEVLVENKLLEGKKYFGRTIYMNPVIFEMDNCSIGETTNVIITSFNQKNLFGIKNMKIEAA